MNPGFGQAGGAVFGRYGNVTSLNSRENLAPAEAQRVGFNHRIPGNLVKAGSETKIYQAVHDVRAGEPRRGGLV